MLRKLVVGPYQTNCYILGCKTTGEGIVIDPGDDVIRITHEISRIRLVIRYILFTHGHVDHTGGALELQRIVKAPLFIHAQDASGLQKRPDGHLYEGQEIRVGSYTLKILHTPGHSPGGVCIHAPGAVFTGDTLFAGSVGRTDFPGGNHSALVTGVVEKIFPLGDDLRVYPGHGPASTIGRERLTNPFFTHVRTA
ncbi:MAG: MBL fold metallo-hydrolase [Desulfatiglandales bacterium]